MRSVLVLDGHVSAESDDLAIPWRHHVCGRQVFGKLADAIGITPIAVSHSTSARAIRAPAGVT